VGNRTKINKITKKTMKVKYLGALLLAATLTFFGCDDNTGTLGTVFLSKSYFSGKLKSSIQFNSVRKLAS